MTCFRFHFVSDHWPGRLPGSFTSTQYGNSALSAQCFTTNGRGTEVWQKERKRKTQPLDTFCLIWLSQIYSLYTFYLLTEISLCKHVIIAIQDTTWIAFCWPHELQQTFLSKASDLMLDLMEEAKLEEIMLEERTRMADAKLDIVLSVHTMTLDVLGSL